MVHTFLLPLFTIQYTHYYYYYCLAPSHMKDVIIIGSGPAGYTAAIYAARSGLETLMFAGDEVGGQLMWTTAVENFPGFPEGVQGPDLMAAMRKQAEKFGAEIVSERVESAGLSSRPFKVTVNGETHEAETVIISTGASAKWLGLESERALTGRGVSACATCDGFFFRDKKVAVVGGGDSAMEEASFLTRFAKDIVVLVRGDKLKASEIMQKRAKDDPKVTIRFNVEVAEVLGVGEGRVTGLRLRDTGSGEMSEEDFDGMFVAIGRAPNTKMFEGQLELDRGYIVTKDCTTKTSAPGVFAAGDVQDFRYRQAVTAAGTGCMAAIDAKRFLEGESVKG